MEHVLGVAAAELVCLLFLVVVAANAHQAPNTNPNALPAREYLWTKPFWTRFCVALAAAQIFGASGLAIGVVAAAGAKLLNAPPEIVEPLVTALATFLIAQGVVPRMSLSDVSAEAEPAATMWLTWLLRRITERSFARVIAGRCGAMSAELERSDAGGAVDRVFEWKLEEMMRVALERGANPTTLAGLPRNRDQQKKIRTLFETFGVVDTTATLTEVQRHRRALMRNPRDPAALKEIPLASWPVAGDGTAHEQRDCRRSKTTTCRERRHLWKPRVLRALGLNPPT